MEKLFFELIRVAIGNAVCLSHTPKAAVWNGLYAMAKKQSLVGICFAGVQRLQSQQQSPPEMLYLQWMGMAAKIQQRNGVVNSQCVQLQAKLADVGFKSCILKGQGAASLYTGNLSQLRQSGDIDIWICGGKEAAVACTRALGANDKPDDHHIHLDVFNDTSVELHFGATPLINRMKNRVYQEWVKSHALSDIRTVSISDGGKFFCPSNYFNMVYMLSHMHKHLFQGGLGLRQMMDYYMVLRDLYIGAEKIDELKSAVDRYGLTKFAGAVMWIMAKVFGAEESFLPWSIDEKRGRYILREMMRGGNFGHYDDDFKPEFGASHLKRYCQVVIYGLRHIRLFPAESFWIPIDYFKMFLAIRSSRN